MNDISEDQIQCVFDCGEEVAIFDSDNWNQEEEAVLNSSCKSLPGEATKREAEGGMIKKLSEELEKSKQNFCKVSIVKSSHKPKDFGLEQIKSSKKIEIIGKKNPNSVLKQGSVYKKTDGIFFQWQSRFMALTPDKLYFFAAESRQKLIGCINLRLLPTKIKESEGNLVLDFDGQCENMILKFDKDAEKKEWKGWLEKVIEFHAMGSKLMLKTIMKPIYDCKDSVTEREFLERAETGDILLFHTNNTGAKIQRVLTNSDYDHVAMVVKFRKKQLMVFESNAIHGVAVFEWGQYIRYFDLYKKVTLRKLNYLRKPELHHSLLNFAKKNLGKNYDIGAHKFFKLESDFDWEKANQEIQEDKNRGYFCSELIAKAYKSVGLIDSKKSSGRYWPVDFSEDRGILLKKGAWLGPEQPIILSKHVKNRL